MQKSPDIWAAIRLGQTNSTYERSWVFGRTAAKTQCDHNRTRHFEHHPPAAGHSHCRKINGKWFPRWMCHPLVPVNTTESHFSAGEELNKDLLQQEKQGDASEAVKEH